jgi:hypothetical protein
VTSEQQGIISSHQTSAPIDITALATALGLSVYDEDLQPGISGKICRDDSGESPAGYAISVNVNEPYLRRRFTIAHECAHFLLHRAKIGDGILDDPLYRSQSMDTQEEFEANNTAADLLMPPHLINGFIRQGIANPMELARRFQVSEPAMRVRIRYLYRAF